MVTVLDRSHTDIPSAGWSKRLETRLVVEFVACLTIALHRNFVSNTLSCGSINVYQMFSHWIAMSFWNPLLSIRNITSMSSVSGAYNSLDRIFCNAQHPRLFLSANQPGQHGTAPIGFRLPQMMPLDIYLRIIPVLDMKVYLVPVQSNRLFV